MRMVNIHDAKTNFSRLVDEAAEGEVIVIAKAGRPVAKLMRLDAPAERPPRLGFLAGMATVPDDIDTWASGEIAALFEGMEDPE
jgi:prevent-host-death family protein